MVFDDGEPATPLCYRPEHPSAQLKIYTKCIEGLKVPFTGDSEEKTLLQFRNEVKAHMEACGMDSVFYHIHPKDGEENIITHYARFTIKQIKDATKDMTDRFDK